ncbi:MAG: hypothetical protein EAZ91_22125 [Cytophagales bacterium]|nr:MAG: hypothetical protein EAZ91_22125 [Cytophagales bacterium]
MRTPLDLLTPDEWLRADNQFKMLKLELEHKIQIDPFSEDTPPELVSNYLDSMLAIQPTVEPKTLVSVYETIGCPPFRPDTDLTDAEITHALGAMIVCLSKFGIKLDILSPGDYSDRTIYRFVTNELFSYQSPDLTDDEGITFIYEEFHPNHRYDIVRQTQLLVRGLIHGKTKSLCRCLSAHFLTETWTGRRSITLAPATQAAFNELSENWWPHRLRGASIQQIQIDPEAQSALVTLQVQLGVNGDTNSIVKRGTVLLNRWDLWWFVEKIAIDTWRLE